MSETKRQLRAEAVERLKEPRYDSYSDVLKATLEWGHEPHSFHEAREALIDLLTDEELPEGDAAAILREADDGSVRLKAFAYDPRSLTRLANMVERDYVRREDHEEPRVNNLTWLYENEPVFRANVGDLAATYSHRRFSPYHWDEDVGEWLMSEHAEVVLNAEEYDLGPESEAESCTEKAGRKSPPEGGPGPCGQPSDDIVADIREKLEAVPPASFAAGNAGVVADAAIKAVDEEQGREKRESLSDTREKLEADIEEWLL